MNEMELIISNQENLQPIEFNFEELKIELAERLQHYNSLTYTEDEIKTAKADRATLNKFKDAIEKRRKEIKAQCLKPYEDFEKKVKEIVKMIDEPILAIDGQVKKFEIRVKEEKRAEIQTFYAEVIGDLSELLPLVKVWNEKWLNATVTLKSVKDEINETIARVKNDLEVISGLQTEFEFQTKDVYLKTLNLSAALQEKTRLEERKARQDEYDRVQAEKRAEQARQEAEKAKQPEVITIETEPDGHTLTKDSYESLEGAFAQAEHSPEPVTMQIDFRIWATHEQLMSLKAFLLENNIKYGKVC
jgi:hypothetical protein